MNSAPDLFGSPLSSFKLRFENRTGPTFLSEGIYSVLSRGLSRNFFSFLGLYLLVCCCFRKTIWTRIGSVEELGRLKGGGGGEFQIFDKNETSRLTLLAAKLTKPSIPSWPVNWFYNCLRKIKHWCVLRLVIVIQCRDQSSSHYDFP